MNCQACGAELVADGVYCHRCGKIIDEAAPTDAAQVQRQEIDLWQGACSARAMIPGGVGLGLLSILLLALVLVAPVSWRWGLLGLWLAVMLTLWAYYGVIVIHRMWGSRYRLTSQRFFHQLGVLLRSTDCIHLVDVDAIQVVQSLPQRLLGVGTITILTHDVFHPKLVLRGIADIDRVFTLLNMARREEQSLRDGRPSGPEG
jgi:uncharacterized membrane protein YdbT with pleckstrin-like domain